jgi:hypothetical protein
MRKRRHLKRKELNTRKMFTILKGHGIDEYRNNFQMKVSVLFFLLIFQFTYNYSFCQEKDSTGVYVTGASFDMMTWAAIPCEKFGSDHAPWLKYSHVTHKDTLAMLDSFLGKVEYVSHYEIDVRAKMIYIKADKVRTVICMNDGGIMINGRLIKRDERFIAFLRGLTPYK